MGRVKRYNPKTKKVAALLKELQAQKTHMAVVLDEYGGTLGIVTMEDILEEIVGNIEDDIDELLRFPNGTHDDFVDMLSQYLLNYEYRYSGKVDTDNRFSALSKAIRGF